MDLDLHYNVYGCFRDPMADVELAADAVDAGFEGVWIGDHFMPWLDNRTHSHEVFSWFGTFMNEVPDVPVGTSVSCPMLRNRPPLFAQSIATLDNMYPGRFNLGVGVGEALNEAHFVDGEWPDWPTRARMLIESIDLMRELWTSEDHVTFDGDYFEYDGIKLYTRPREHVPIHWAGWGPKSCELAGRFADHLLTVAGPDLLEDQIVPNLHEGLAKADRDPDDVDVTTEFGVSVGDPDDLVAEIRERGEYIPDDTELDNPDPRGIQSVANDRLAEMSDAEVREAHHVTEDPDEVIADLEALAEAGATRVLVGSTVGDPRRTIELFEDHVIPHFA